jgi:hypothetical protein
VAFMPRLSTAFDVFIASPSDIVDERVEVRKVIADWNATHSRKENTILNPILWESHSWPEMGDRPQAILNKQIVDECDILIGFFWTRIGTPTGSEVSGTIEEIKNFWKDKKPVLLYFSSRSISPENIDLNQLEKLKQFKLECKNFGLISEYESIEELRTKLMKDISFTVENLQNRFGFIPRIGMSETNENPVKKISKKIFIFLNRLKMELDGIFSDNSVRNQNQVYSRLISQSRQLKQVINWGYTELWEIYGEMNFPEFDDSRSFVEHSLKNLEQLKSEMNDDNILSNSMSWMNLNYNRDVQPDIEEIIVQLEKCRISLEKIDEKSV